MFSQRSWLIGCLLLATCGLNAPTFGSDWPMWRHDVNRSAASPENLPENLRLQWVREFPPPRPAWPAEPPQSFDDTYEPVVMGKTLFLGSNRNDRLTALNTDTGQERWKDRTERGCEMNGALDRCATQHPGKLPDITTAGTTHREQARVRPHAIEGSRSIGPD